MCEWLFSQKKTDNIQNGSINQVHGRRAYNNSNKPGGHGHVRGPSCSDSSSVKSNEFPVSWNLFFKFEKLKSRNNRHPKSELKRSARHLAMRPFRDKSIHQFRFVLFSSILKGVVVEV